MSDFWTQYHKVVDSRDKYLVSISQEDLNALQVFVKAFTNPEEIGTKVGEMPKGAEGYVVIGPTCPIKGILKKLVDQMEARL